MKNLEQEESCDLQHTETKIKECSIQVLVPSNHIYSHTVLPSMSNRPPSCKYQHYFKCYASMKKPCCELNYNLYII